MKADHTPLTPAIVPFDLRSVTRGYRHFGVWLGYSQYVWLDRRLGRIAAKVAVRLPHPAVQALPGHIANESRLGKPMLSWIALPAPSSTGCPSIADAIDDEIAHYAPRCDPATLLSLMQRVRRTHALAEPRGSLQCPRELQESGTVIRILLIDEPAKASGDIPTSRRREAFSRMLDAARTTHPDAEFWLGCTRHPGCGGWLSDDAGSALPPTIRRLAPADSLCAAIERVDYVYTVGAPEGMHALLAEIPLHVFGDAYYAGRGLTRDADESVARRRSATLPALFEIMFLRLTRYLNPVTHSLGTLSDVLDSIELQQNVAQRFAGIRHVAGVRFQRWKRPFATPFLAASGATLRWIAEAQRLRSGECAALWGA
ncbi:capsular biosynthesis protein, partial [Burkholderia multivorans]